MNGISTIDLRRGLVGALALLAALCLALVISASASATPELKGTFACGDGDGSNPPKCGDFESWTPDRLAVNEDTGDVYVIDTENDAIQVFDEDGAYKDQILKTELPGEPGDQTFGFGSDADIAIDNSGGAGQGRVYVVAGFARFFAFDADHSFDWTKKGILNEPCGVAVKPNGDLYGSGYGGGVQQLSTTDGSLVGSPIVSSGSIGDTCQIAFDAEDDLYLRRWENGAIVKLLAPGYALPPQTIRASGITDVEVNRTTGFSYMAGSATAVVFYDAAGNQSPNSPVNSGAPGRAYIGVATNPQTARFYVNDATNKTVEIWQIPQLALTIAPAGTGTGKVECEVGGGPVGPCAATYLEGTEVTLIATPNAGNTFESLTGGGCTTSPCTVTVNDVTNVTANFTAITHGLTITKAGSGAAPSSVTCKVGAGPAGPCAAEYNEGTTVTVAAVPGANVKFDGFTGACSSVPCAVLIDADKALTATFTQMRKLTLSKTGNGASPSAITCAVSPDPAGPCETDYPTGTVVTIAAEPGEHVQFNGFTGSGCTTSPCAVTMSSDKTLIANFTVITHTLVVSKAGTGSGSVTCNGGACASSYEEGTKVTLAASAESGSTFSGWSGGGCSGTSGCTVTLNAATTVTATFAKDEVKSISPEEPLPPVVDPPRPPQPESIKCKKGFKKKTVKGKAKCVKVKKIKKKRKKR